MTGQTGFKADLALLSTVYFGGGPTPAPETSGWGILGRLAWVSMQERVSQ